MKTVTSEERSTGMGAICFEAVLAGSEWMKVSDMPDARYEGRNHGYESYEVDVANDAITAYFYRSNSGKMSVRASNGKAWGSFGAADRWATGDSAPTTCPHCGQEM